MVTLQSPSSVGKPEGKDSSWGKSAGITLQFLSLYWVLWATAPSPALVLLLLHVVSPVCPIQNPAEEVLLCGYSEGDLWWCLWVFLWRGLIRSLALILGVQSGCDITAGHVLQPLRSEGLHSSARTCTVTVSGALLLSYVHVDFVLFLTQPHKNIMWDLTVKVLYQGLN